MGEERVTRSYTDNNWPASGATVAFEVVLKQLHLNCPG